MDEELSEENKNLVRRYFEAPRVNSLDNWDPILAENYVHHDANLPDEGQASPAAHKEAIQGFITAFPDLTIQIQDMAAEGDKVAVRWSFNGINGWDFMGMPATGKSVTVDCSSFHRIAGGKIAEAWVNFNAMGMMHQLGAIPD